MRRPPSILSFFRYPTTAGTCLLAVGLTLAWWNKMPVEQFIMDGGIRKGEIWRLVTGTLLHVNALHLLFNVYWTWVFGTLLEEHLGHFRTLGLFILFGIASGAAEYAVLSGGVGLSGVGYGLFGLMWVLHKRDRRFADGIDAATVQLFLVWFVICIVLTVAGAMAVANIAHGIGAVAGAATGFAMAARGGRRVAIASAIGLVTAVFIAGAVWFRPYVNLSRNARDEDQLAWAALEANDYPEAEKWLRQAVRINPKDDWAWYNLGYTCEKLGRRDDARQAYGEAMQLNPAKPNYRTAYESVSNPGASADESDEARDSLWRLLLGRRGGPATQRR